MVRLPPRLRPLFPYLKPAHVRATRVAARVTPRLGMMRGSSWLPNTVAHTLDQAAAASGGRCVTARAAEVIQRHAIVGSPPGMPLTDTSDGEHIPRIAVAELPDARVLGPHRAVITDTGALVQEVSRYFGTSRPDEHPLFLNPFPPPPLELTGRVGVLGCRGDANYYHFLVEVLPRLGLVEQSGLAEPERWYVPAATRFQRELLDLFDITGDRLVDASTHLHIRAEELVVPGLAGPHERNPPWVVQFLRDRLLDEAGVPRPRRGIYVTRGPSTNNRSVVNETEVAAMLADRGFDAVDPGTMSVRDQIRAFADARVIVAPHGAALANVVFCRPGATVIELFPAGSLLPDYWRLASGVPGLRYRYLSSRGGPVRVTRASTIVRDIEVDLGGLRALLDEAAQHDAHAAH